MWIKRDLKEIVALSHKRNKQRTRGAIILGMVATLFLSITHTVWELASVPSIFVPSHEIIMRLPLAILVGLGFSIIAFKYGKNRQVVICCNCGQTKFADEPKSCECNSVYENIEDVKWVD